MQWLNYQHLLYFWAVARRGSVTAASNELRLAAPRLSAQIRKLEESLGYKLLRRSGNRLVLTDAGVRVMPYAEEIFSLGQQVTELYQGTSHRTPLRLAVGTVDVLPRWLTYRLLEPALRQPQQFQVIFRKDRPERLMADLAAHDLDIVFSDVPVIPAMRTQFLTQLLGESGTSFYATQQIATSYLRNFPRCLEGAPADDSVQVRRTQIRLMKTGILANFTARPLLRLYAVIQCTALMTTLPSASGHVCLSPSLRRILMAGHQFVIPDWSKFSPTKVVNRNQYGETQ